MRSPSSASANSRATARMARCSAVSSTSTALHGGADVLVHEAHDVLRGGPGPEQLLDAHLLELRHVLGRDDAAAEHRDVVGALLLQQVEHGLEQIVVRAGQDGETD